jgi:hypothetical protein
MAIGLGVGIPLGLLLLVTSALLWRQTQQLRKLDGVFQTSGKESGGTQAPTATHGSRKPKSELEGQQISELGASQYRAELDRGSQLAS